VRETSASWYSKAELRTAQEVKVEHALDGARLGVEEDRLRLPREQLPALLHLGDAFFFLREEEQEDALRRPTGCGGGGGGVQGCGRGGALC